jgi:serine/threonine protein kinase
LVEKELITEQKNILISDNDHALIADFGISYLTVSINSASTQVSNGSVRWMAPELVDIDRDCRPTLQSDIWSLGCVCYEVRFYMVKQAQLMIYQVFTSNTPFCDYFNDRKVLSALMLRTRRPADTNLLDNVSIQERELMNKCWSYEPDSRASCEEIYKFVIDLAGERDSAKVQDVALWKAIRGRPGMAVNHVHAHRILLCIRGIHGYPPGGCVVIAYSSASALKYSSI